ncbi:hypothetical protein OK414_29435 [Priestia sp. JV24]|uniref:hypothetical protein n=1 Tax=Priestia TaxID=2800373 RepID=UPI0021D69670|nr:MULTISPECIES: hypothetical protein [Priestia]MCU7712993.1 hypothetical protein [Priestia megaterium]MCW1049178.1 hypothetical protein [Priestia sp. JV24]
MSLSELAKEQKRAYYREYREKNRERYNQRAREWRANNKDKVKQYQKDYWERKSQDVE